MSIQIPQDRYIKVGNVNTRYWQAGERGSFVLLIHGFPASVEAWEKNINVLARQHRVYALDWLGSGRTDKLPLVKDMFEVVDFIIKFMDTLHIDKASLIGNSMGGGIALAMVIQHPERVEKLVLVNAAGLGPEVATYFHLISIPWLGKLLTGKTTRESVQKMGEAIFYDPSTMTKEMVDLYYGLNQLPGMQQAVLSIARSSSSCLGQRAKYWKLIRRMLVTINLPTIVFWGKQDKIIPVKHAIIAAGIPGAKLHIYDKCGHAPMMEYPDEFNKTVMDFLAE